MTHLRAVVVCAAVAAAGCRAKPSAEEPPAPPPPSVAAKDDAPTFPAPSPADVARVAAEVAPLGGTATAAHTPAVPAVVVGFTKGGPAEADVPELVRRLTATGVPVTVTVTSGPTFSAAAYGKLLAVPNLRGLSGFGPNLFAALAALGDDSPLEHLTAGAPAIPDDAALTKLRRLRVLSLSGPTLPGPVLDRLAELPDLHSLRLAGGLLAADLPRVWRLTGLRSLDLYGDGFADADLAPLATMVNLRSVLLSGEKVTKESFAHLADLPDLTNPGILPGGTGFTDSSLAHLGRLKGAGKIERLQLGGSAVTGAGLAHLRPLTGLKELGLHGVPGADAAGLAAVAALPNLVNLHIGLGHEMLPEERPGAMPRLLTPDIPPAAAFAGLAGAVTVKSLRLENATDAHLLHVGKMPALEELVLTWTDVTAPGEKRQPPAVVMTDAGLAHLRAAPRLRFLSVSGGRVTDAGTAHLAAFPALTELKLQPAALTDAGAAALAKAKGLRVLTLSGTRLTDAGVGALTLLPDLRELHIGSDEVTDAVVDEFLRIPNLEGASVGGARLRGAQERLRAARPGLRRFPPR